MKDFLGKVCGKQMFWAFALIIGVTAFGSNTSAQLINELVVNPDSTDSNCEYVEFIGSPSGSLTGLYFATIEGDSGTTQGVADLVVDMTAGGLGTNGLLVIAGEDPSGACDGRDYGSSAGTFVFRTSIFGGSGGLENGSISFLLIHSPTTAITPGTDYDTDNNGSLEGLPGDAVIMDSVAWLDGGGSDIVYGSVNLPATAGGTPDMATRFPGNTNANIDTAWYYGDMEEAGANSLNYDLTQVSANFPSNGMLTPGNVNVGTTSAFQKANVDFDGDGRSDFNIVRDQTGSNLRGNGSAFLRTRSVRERLKLISERRTDNLAAPANHGTSIVWYIFNSSNSTANIAGFGNAAIDFPVPEDYDGDGKDDIAVFRGINSSSAFFYIFESATSTIREEAFGIENDDPTVVGDYDGDGKADLAVYRCPNSNPGACVFYYRGSNNNPNGNVTFIPFGAGTFQTVLAYPGDYDGDGKYDVCIFRENPDTPGNGQFVLLRSSDFGFEYINWGLTSDLIVPGDYDGDGKSDFMIARLSSTPFSWYLLERDGGGTGINPILWGGGDDVPTPGDYDNDGKQDVAIWRPGAASYFYVRRSTDTSLQTFQWGGDFDYPTANFYVH